MSNRVKYSHKLLIYSYVNIEKAEVPDGDWSDVWTPDSDTCNKILCTTILNTPQSKFQILA